MLRLSVYLVKCNRQLHQSWFPRSLSQPVGVWSCCQSEDKSLWFHNLVNFAAPSFIVCLTSVWLLCHDIISLHKSRGRGTWRRKKKEKKKMARGCVVSQPGSVTWLHVHREGWGKGRRWLTARKRFLLVHIHRINEVRCGCSTCVSVCLCRWTAECAPLKYPG